METNVETPLREDGDYVLGSGSAWITVGSYSVRLQRLERGLQLAVYVLGRETEYPWMEERFFDGDAEVMGVLDGALKA